VVAAEPRDRRDAVDERHMQVDHHRVGLQLVRLLDRFEPVFDGPDYLELRLPIDQRSQRLDEIAIVVCEQYTDPLAFGLRHLYNGSFLFMEVQTDAAGVALIGASLDLGAGRRGVDMGPSAIRYAGLAARIEQLGRRVFDWGNVEGAVAEATAVGSEQVRFLTAIKQACARVAQLVERAVAEGLVPLVLGGDHSVALGTLGGLSRAHGAGGVLWIDAHGDLNRPETSPSGNVHGMPLAAALGLAGAEFESENWSLPAVAPERVALVGIRSLDPAEVALIADAGVQVYTMSDVDRLGIERVVRQSLAQIAGPGFVHVSLDMDALDPDIAPGVGTPVRGGLSYREAHLALELVAESGLAGSIEVVEVNPILDRENETAKLAVELVASALGARIL
jgi:arginase